MSAAPATSAAAARPQLVQPSAGNQPKILTMLQNQQMVDRFKMIVPKHLSPERMLRVMALAVHKTPKLAECDPMTLLGAMMVCGSLGMEPNTPLGHCYLIPFEKRKKVGGQWVTDRIDIQLIIGYKGYIDLARRSGTLVSIHADVVYEGDEFSFEYGSNMHLRHVPRGAREGRKPLWAYAHAKLKDGEAFEVLPYEQVLSVRDGSQGYAQALRQGKDSNAYRTSPWVAHEHEMSAKTMVRRLSKWLSMSIEFANAAQLDSMSEAGTVAFNAFTNMNPADAIGFDPSLAQIEPPAEEPVDTSVDLRAQPGETVTAERQAQPRQQRSTAKQQPAAAPQPEPTPANHDPETGEIADDDGGPADDDTPASNLFPED